MHTDPAQITDQVIARLGHTKMKPWDRPVDAVGAVGYVQAILRDRDGKVKQIERGHNLVTDHGDEMIGERIYDNTQDIATGMRLGTDATAAAKNGAGSFIGAYISTSNEALDSVAAGSDKGAGAGWRVTYVCTWIAGDITNGAIAEVVLSDENPLTDVVGTAANTMARFVFGATIDKQAGDSLEVTWQIDVLGA